MAQVVHQQIPLLVRTIGPSSDLLDILSDPPIGSEGLAIQVLFFSFSCNLGLMACVWSWLLIQLQVVNTLTDGTVPSPNLVSTIKRLYDTKLKVTMYNVFFLFAICGFVLFYLVIKYSLLPSHHKRFVFLFGMSHLNRSISSFGKI